MIQFLYIMSAVVMAAIFAPTNAQAGLKPLSKNGREGTAKIDLQKDTNKITVRSLFVDGEAGKVLTYKLSVEKSGKSGTSNNAQSGKFEIKPGQQEVVLSTSGFSAYPQDKYFIQLQVFEGDKLISQDTLEYEITGPEKK